MSDFFSFKLSPSFIEQYKDREPDWGWKDAAGNSIGELTFVRTYSRVKPDGSKERWFEVAERVINGMYSLQKDHCLSSRLEWNGHKAQASAQEAYDRLFNLKWTPPGRGLFTMGTPLVMREKNIASLLNCGFVSTGDMDRNDPGYPFAWLTEALMLGVGIGFDTLGADKFEIYDPTENGQEVFVIPDTREGWAISVGKLVNSFLKKGKPEVIFDYSEIRPYGSPIKTFGGTASGPDPLKLGHQQIRDDLTKNVGELFSSVNITNVSNIIGTFVVAGNTRRSAEIAIGLPEDEDFLNLKNSDVFPDRPWAYMSNNSINVPVGTDYSPFIKNTVKNGEPGYIWMENVQKFGRMSDAPDYKDHRAKGFNPCQPEWAQVLTPNGISTIGSISVGDQIWSEDGWVTVENKWSTGIKKVNRYTTTAGFVDCTENHRVVSKGLKLAAFEASSIDRISGPRASFSINELSTQDVVNGLTIGDGYKHLGSNDAYFLVVGDKDFDYFNTLTNYLEFSSGRAYRVSCTINKDDFSRRVFDRTIPIEYMQSNSKKIAGLLRGIYSSNGSICGRRVTLKSTSHDLILQVQTLLSSLGIASYYTTNKSHEVEWENGTYTSKQSYDLNIAQQESKELFAKSIGFLQNYKTDKLTSILEDQRRSSRGKQTFDIISVESLGEHAVFDITVSGSSHTYWSSGMNISNCSEQPLESFELCCLSEMHLNRAESLSDFLRTLKFCYLYSKTVTLLSSPWPRSNSTMLRNRRIGLSTTGVAGFIENHSLAEYREWADKGYKRVSELDVEFSEWLGIRESIRKTTVKPSGSVSLLSGATPGVHWAPGGRYFMRAIRFGVHDNTWKLLEQAGYKTEDDVYSSNTKVVYFPLESKAGRAESQVSIYEKANLAAEAQAYWSDNGVSVTLSFSPNEAEDVEKILHMYEGKLKAVSFLPMLEEGAYAQMPYSPLTEEEFREASKGLKRINVNELYNEGEDASGEIYCSTDSCELKSSKLA